MYEERKKGFFEELQSLDEPTKKKIMIVAAVVIMAMVIYVWLAYFNNLLASVTQPPVADNSTAGASGGNLFDGIQQGTASIYRLFMNALHGLSSILEAPRQYIIHPPQ